MKRKLFKVSNMKDCIALTLTGSQSRCTMSIYNINFIETCLLQKLHSAHLNGNKQFTTYLHYPNN